MKSVINYFIKDYKFNSNIELFRVKSLLLILFTGLVLLVGFMINILLSNYSITLYTQYLYVLAGIISLLLIKKGKYKFVGNFLSLLLVLTEIFALYSNPSNSHAVNFFVDEFYMFLVFLFFTTLFAERYVLIINSLLILTSSLFAYYFYENQFPESITSELQFGIGVYTIAVLSVFFFNYLYSYLIINAIKEISDHADDTNKKNIQLTENTEFLTKQKHELKEAKEKAEESDKLKSTFLANMSHEIRTPMNAILGFTEILTETELDKKQAEYINIIKSSGNHLLELINDIIDISKLESNQLQIVESKCNLNNLLKNIKIFFELSLNKNHKEDLNLELSLGLENHKDMIYTDTTRLRQILINLIGNAIKFTVNGTISISYKKTENELLFIVKDTGIGIPKKQLPIIFERFRQADESTTKKFGGTGLGLSISKACTELLGGKIWAESEKENGSSFYFTIPYKPVT